MLDKWQELLDKLKRDYRCTEIKLYHEKTLAKMKLNLFEIRRKYEWVMIILKIFN